MTIPFHRLALPLTLLALIPGQCSLAQAQTDSHEAQTEEAWIRFSFRSEFDAPGIGNHLLLDLRNGKFIERSRVLAAYDRLDGTQQWQTAGTATSTGFTYGVEQRAEESRTIGYLFGMGHTSVTELAYDKELFGMVFLGNKYYAGSELALSNNGFRMSSVQDLFTGKYWVSESDTSRLYTAVTISLLKGQFNQEVNIRKASIYTHPYGDEISFMMDYSYLRSDTQYTRYLDMNGYGFGLGASIAYSTPRYSFSATLSNLGAVRWINNRYQYDKDSSFTYEGWNIPNIFDAKGKIFEGATPDSAYAVLRGQNLGRNTWRPAPGILSAEVSVSNLRAGFYHYLFTRHIPMVYFGPELHAAAGRMTMMPYFEYGGYGAGHFGMRILLQQKGNYLLSADVGAIDALLSGEEGTGFNAWISFQKQFTK